MPTPVPAPLVRTVAYGPSPSQVGDLYLPAAVEAAGAPGAASPGGAASGAGASPRGTAPVICLLHGGFWRMPWARDHIAPIALDLAHRGWCVWNLEYRRVGQTGGGWPGTFEDVKAGVAHLSRLAAAAAPFDPTRTTVIGHSAGGHLALWVAKHYAPPGPVRITQAVGLAAVADLRLALDLHSGNGAVRDFIGCAPEVCADRYAVSSPAQMVPLGVEQLLLHGTRDEDVPVEISRHYAETARAAGDALTFVELEDACHMDFVEPRSTAHAVLCRWLERPR